MAILGKKKVNIEVIKAMYTPILKKSRDKETGELDGKYPTTMKLKLHFGMVRKVILWKVLLKKRKF